MLVIFKTYTSTYIFTWIIEEFWTSRAGGQEILSSDVFNSGELCKYPFLLK